MRRTRDILLASVAFPSQFDNYFPPSADALLLPPYTCTESGVYWPLRHSRWQEHGGQVNAEEGGRKIEQGQGLFYIGGLLFQK